VIATGPAGINDQLPASGGGIEVVDTAVVVEVGWIVLFATDAVVDVD
jgi:hypothetical protein